ncbi:hypothetical protein [Leptospira kanakyensis]|uniref:hypothetical protein n=1 Tax=Leptospira kanakyensis TaxID=2484968 RepID=UPI00223CF75F|nr:hypothetical protein [Leptospira kanakyensis]MCW7471709.1 hypothetical protein [Leptospira kanakyensis]
MENVLNIYHAILEILHKVKETFYIWFPDNKRKQIWRGHRFEKYIVDLFDFNNSEFSLIDWTSDIDFVEFNVTVERNLDPDLLIKHKKSNKLFAIECKFRSWITIDNGKEGVEWARQDQIARYLKYGKDNNINVYVALGIGDYPAFPRELYLIPIENAKYPNLSLYSIKDFKRKEKELVQLLNGSLK